MFYAVQSYVIGKIAHNCIYNTDRREADPSACVNHPHRPNLAKVSVQKGGRKTFNKSNRRVSYQHTPQLHGEHTSHASIYSEKYIANVSYQVLYYISERIPNHDIAVTVLELTS